jgi:hypothetical protein
VPKKPQEIFTTAFPKAAERQPSPLQEMEQAIEDHFEASETAHFCQAPCAEDILVRMNARHVYIINDEALVRLHTSCHSEIRWYRDALTTIRDGGSVLKPEAVAKLALERDDE